MSGEVTAIPWKADKGVKNRWRVYVPPQPMPDGGATKAERVVRTAYSKSEALRWGQERREIVMEEYRARQRGELDARKPKVISFAKLTANEWLPYLRVLVAQQLRKPSSVEGIESLLAIHVTPFIGTLPINQISNSVMTRLIERWTCGGYHDLRGRPVRPTTNPKTINNRKTVVNAALKFAVERGHVALMPCRIEIRHVEGSEAEHYESEVYERLLDGARAVGDDRVHVALLLGGDAGLRRGEILALNCADVNLRSGKITVRRGIYWRRGREGREPIETLPKGKRVKPVSATARLLKALQTLIGGRKTGRVLTTSSGDQVTPKMLKLWVIRAEEAAGLPKTGRLHVLRHSHLTHLADAGATLLEIASQARHADLRITQRYLHAREGAAAAGVRRLEQHRAAEHAPTSGAAE